MRNGRNKPGKSSCNHEIPERHEVPEIWWHQRAHRTGEHCSSRKPFMFRVVRVFRGLNCRFWVQKNIQTRSTGGASRAGRFIPREFSPRPPWKSQKAELPSVLPFQTRRSRRLRAQLPAQSPKTHERTAKQQDRSTTVRNSNICLNVFRVIIIV